MLLFRAIILNPFFGETV